MPGAYSTDLRERVLVAVEAGEPADAVAEGFMVGRSSVHGDSVLGEVNMDMRVRCRIRGDQS